MNLYDLAYVSALICSTPYWLLRPSARRKVASAFQDIPRRDGDSATVMIHAVSLGEINATRTLIDKLRTVMPGIRFVVSSTTDTGLARAADLYATQPDITLIRYPLDFSWEVSRVLDAVRPDVVALMELEVWPNFMRVCSQRKIPVVLINARLTETSFKRYRWLGPITKKMFGRLAAVCAQEQSYADRLLALGASPPLTRVTGTMKFDTSPVATSIPGDLQLAREVGLDPFNEPIWVCGSTGPGEERIILERYRSILGRFPRLRLAIIPRKPERFDEVAELIVKNKFYVVRRSRGARLSTGPLPPIILGDTVGELKKFYSLASIVFVGRTLVDLGQRQAGSDMIEPAALGKPVIVGPHTGNFAEPVRCFKVADAIMVVSDAAELEQAVAVLLSTPQKATDIGRRAQQVVKENQGATTRNGQILYDILIDRILPPESPAISPEAETIAQAAISDESPDDAMATPTAARSGPLSPAIPRSAAAETDTPLPRSSAPQPPPARTLRGNLNDDLPPPDFIIPHDPSPRA